MAEKNLVVYSASAGSGKTFTLAAHYIAIVLANPDNFRHTLAVTFTNKATVEMKERILKFLYDLSHDFDATDKNFIALVKQFLEEAGKTMSNEEMSANAKVALSSIIHHYGLMHIETIDSFFQKVLRGLAHEMGLSNNLRVELNDSAIEKEAVDHLLEGTNGNTSVDKILSEWIDERLNNGKSWDYRKDLEAFGNEIFKTAYKQIADKIESLSLEKVTELKKTLYTEKEKIGQRQLKILDENESITDNKLFQKWINKQKSTATEQPLDLSAKTPSKYLSISVIEEIERLEKRWNSAELTLKHLNELMLLKSLDEKVKQMNKEADRFLLSDTQHLLSMMIGDHDDAPFIYEKMGTWIEHIMIDEFQDTGLNQWQNFKVLLKNSMSQNESRNLIVGDVKQSIYRWRDGDWRILSDLHGCHQTENSKGLTSQTEPRTLSSNFRSHTEIVEWNNRVFPLMRDAVTEWLAEKNTCTENLQRLQEAYSDMNTHQKAQKKNGGSVSLTMFRTKTKNDGDYEKPEGKKINDKDISCSWVKDMLEILRAGDIHRDWSDTVILVRKNKHAQLIANYLKTEMPEVHTVSAEAFLLSNAWSVKVIIALLHCIAQPKEKLWKATVQQLLKTKDFNAPTEQRSLSETIEYLIREYLPEDNHQEDLYLMTLMDKAREWMRKNRIATVRNFIDAWDGQDVLNIGGNGLNIMTIHKSKGLEFDNVIMPFIGQSESRRPNGNSIWAQSDETPYQQLPAIPVEMGNKMERSVYAESYYEEAFQEYVDQLNLLYVGFTRAKKNLFLLSKYGGKETRSSGDFLNIAVSKMGKDSDPQINESYETQFLGYKFDTYFWGEVLASSSQKLMDSKQENNPFNGNSSGKESVRFATSDFHLLKFRQSNKSKDFINGEESFDTTGKQNYLERGTLLHKAMENILDVDDIERIDDIFQRMTKEGLVDQQQAQELAKELKKLLHKGFQTFPFIHESWFGKHLQLFNERSILTKDESGNLQTKRPDRVVYDVKKDIITVVDYKFGKEHPAEYENQVREYMELLRQMGYHTVKGYLWYVLKNDIKSVE